MTELVRKIRWTEFISIGTAVSSLAFFIFVFGIYKGSVDAHMSNRDVHMTAETKFNTFVPRQELEKIIMHGSNDLTDVKADLKDLSNKLDRKFEELQALIIEQNLE